MGDVYGNVNVNYSYCKSVAQLKSAADYILGRKKEQVEDGVVKTESHLYKAFGCNRDNFANSLLMTRKMHDKKYSRYKQKEILAQKLSISFHPEDNDRLTYEQAYKIAEDFAREFFWSKGYEVLFAVHTDTAHTHVHFLVSNCNVKDGKSFRRGPAELKEMCRYFGEQCREYGLTHSYRDTYYVKDRDRERQSFAEYQMKKRDKLSFREEIKVLLRNAMNRPENKSLQDVIEYAKKYYLMDVRLRGNTISYALKYRTDKKGKPMSVRGSRLGARFTVAGITEYLKKKEKSRLEYERIKADIEQESGRYDDYADWKEPSDTDEDVKSSVQKDRSTETGNKQAPIESNSVDKKNLEKEAGTNADISIYEGFDRFCKKENIRDDEEEVFYGAAFDEFNREWQGIASEEQTEPASRKEEQEIPPDYTKMSIQERVRQLPPPTEDTSQEFEACSQKFSNRSGSWFMDVSNFRELDEILAGEEYQIKTAHPFFIPKDNHVCEMNGIEVKKYNQQEILSFKGDDRFDEAFCFEENSPDVLAVAAIIDHEIVGMAGASADSPYFWQIGINVNKEFEGRHIASGLVSILKRDILEKDIVPYYGTSFSNLASQHVAAKAGFEVAWVELITEKIG